ncbi:MAG: DUF424 family protein [Candidatus Aenigmatarchaeota archaeon]
MFYYKIHKSRGKTLLAVCDSDLLGKKFEEGKLALYVNREFYGGQEIGNDVLDFFPKADIINITGSKIVSLALKTRWVSKEGIIRIRRIPHAQIFSL